MKLFGNSSKKRSRGKASSNVHENTQRKKSPEELREIEAQIAAYQKFKTKRRIIVLSIILVILIGAFVLYKITVKPPKISNGGLQKPSTTTNGGGTSSGQTQNQQPSQTGSESNENPDDIGETDRRKGCYTFLIVGSDNGYGNTDTIMVGMLDTGKEELNVLSIPRDTLVNVSWATKKVNTLLAFSGVDGLMSGISSLMGYEIDNYAIVDLSAFEAIVDTIGGVWFDVPMDMQYVAEDQNPPLYIDIKKGYQHLDGAEALKVMRFRAGYVSADIGRIGTQQALLSAMAEQCISLGNLFKFDEFVKIFKQYVDTSLTDGNVLWYAKTILGMKSENIHFYTMPENYNDSVKGYSYCSIYIDEWLEMLNEHFNPWNVEITAENLDILTRDSNGNLYATTGSIAGGYDSFYDHNAYLASLASSSQTNSSTEADSNDIGSSNESESTGETDNEPQTGTDNPDESPEQDVTQPTDPLGTEGDIGIDVTDVPDSSTDTSENSGGEEITQVVA